MNMRKGTPNQLINEMLAKIDELKSEAVKSTTDVEAGCDEDVKAGCDKSVKAGCDDKVDSSCADSSAVVFDDDEDVIEADDDIEFEDEEVFEPEEEVVEEEVVEEIPVEDVEEADELADELDTDEYLDTLYHRVEESLSDLTEGISWDNDKDNIFLDIAFADGHVFTFTIPKADLAYDLESLDTDAEYICVAVRDTHEPEEEIVDEEVIDEKAIEDDYDIPAYV